MRAIRQSGSVGGGGREASPYPKHQNVAPLRGTLEFGHFQA